MSPDSSVILQSIVLGSLFVVIAATTDTAYALAAGAVAATLSRGSRVRALGRYVAGGAFIAMGVLAALSDVPGDD
jgi:threonine/homoserine/homoserine lactone efflux protein